MQSLTIKTLSILPFLLLMTIGKLSAQTYYVSPDASATWPLCSDINQPCSPATAMENAVAGDTVYFRGGQYDLYYDSSIPESYYWYRGILNPTNSGTLNNPITFMAYPNETPIMNANTYAVRPNLARAFGNNGSKNYIVYDGFTVMADNGVNMGGIIIAGNNTAGTDQRVVGNVVKNMIFNGGSTVITSLDNHEGLRLERTTGSLIQNNEFFSYRQNGNGITDWANTAAIKMYFNDQAIIENMEIYNSSAAIYLKVDNDNSIIRNNFLHDNYNSLPGQVFGSGASLRDSDNIAVYNNVIVNSDYTGIGVSQSGEGTADGWEVYNNTVYNFRNGIQGTRGSWKIWNNIVIRNPNQSFNRSIWLYNGNLLTESEYNQFGPTVNVITNVNDDPPVAFIYTSLAAWQASGELENGGNPGVGSLASDPMFMDASGTLSELEDFRLAVGSPSIGTGRNGVDMGANINTVGVYPNLPSGLIFTNGFEEY